MAILGFGRTGLGRGACLVLCMGRLLLYKRIMQMSPTLIYH